MPETSSFASRRAADRCPGVLRLIEAADGYLARVRLPGGLVSGKQLRVLARLAGELGDGRVELTSRGNVQLRGLAASAASPLTSELIQAGLLPSVSHDRVRNVLASPLAGLDGGPGLTGIVRALDAALCARPRLAELSGRFLFAVDDGRGDVAGLGADVVATIRPGGAVVNGLFVRRSSSRQPDTADGDAPARETSGTGTWSGPDADAMGTAGPGTAGSSGHRTGHRTGALDLAVDAAGADGDVPGDPRDATVTVMLAFAEAFLDLRAELGGTAWRIADLPDGAERVRATVAALLRLGADGSAWPAGPAVREGTGGSARSSARLPGRPGACPLDGRTLDGRTADGEEPRADPAARPVGIVTRQEASGGSGPAGLARPGPPPGSARLADQPRALPPGERPADQQEPGTGPVARPVGLVTPRQIGGGPESAGTVRDDAGGSAVLIVPLGRLTSAQLSWVAGRLAGQTARITPWRSIVLPCLANAAAVLHEAAGLGFGTDAASPWLRVTACAGRPGCASALADVQADAAGFAARWPGRLVHVSGCARHCGRPAATEIDVTAASEGYRVAGV